MRQILIGALIVLMLKFRPQGIFPDRHGVPRSARRTQGASGATGGGWRDRVPLLAARPGSGRPEQDVAS